MLRQFPPGVYTPINNKTLFRHLHNCLLKCNHDRRFFSVVNPFIKDFDI